MPRLLITGASGLLGANLACRAAAEHQVVGVSRRRPLRLSGVTAVLADLAAEGQARRLLEQQRPDWVVHCAAATDLEGCERQTELARTLNVDMARQVAEACRAVGARLAHLSTDSVFDGAAGEYRELDEPRPVNTYARTKLEGERAVQAAYPEALIVRTNFFGWAVVPRPSLAEWFLDRLERGQRTPGFADVYFSPLVVDHLAQFLLELLGQGAYGLLHLPGATCLSKYEFGVRLAHTLGHDPGLVYPASVTDDAGLAAPRPLRTCLRAERAAALLGRTLPDLEAGLQVLRQTRSERAALRADQPQPEELVHESD
jgi:dTDP-4-dehydrorhamnose reductase